MFEQSYQQKRDQQRGHGLQLAQDPRQTTHKDPAQRVPLQPPQNFHVLLLVWEELWSLVRIIPAEVCLVAGGPRPLRTLASPAEGHV